MLTCLCYQERSKRCSPWLTNEVHPALPFVTAAATASHNLALRLEDNLYHDLSVDWFERAWKLATQEKLLPRVIELLTRKTIAASMDESCTSNNQDLDDDSDEFI